MAKRQSTAVIRIALMCLLLTVAAMADSHVRIVRLSTIEGNIQIDRNQGRGLEKAFLNLPITEGMRLAASGDSRAEVEFEDGSTVRITPNTVIDFSQLSLRSSGIKVSAVNIQEGTAYFNFAAVKDNEFTITFGHESIVATESSHLRAHVGDTKAEVAVFAGSVEVNGPSGTLNVSKKQSATFDLADNDRYMLAKNLEQDPYDSWDKQQSKYQERYADKTYSSYSPYAYGTSDLNYYGNFFSYPGYGLMWQPYFVGAGWDPFMSGAWAFSPGFGYGWVSGYPWGWTPYHYGSWVFLPAYGWAWQPGGIWTVARAPLVVNAPRGFVAPKPPAADRSGLVVVNRGPVTSTASGSGKKVVVTAGSAGLGIPRGQVGNLASLSHQATQSGTASASVHNGIVSSSAARGSAFGGSGGGSRSGTPVASSAHSMTSVHGGRR